MKNNLYHKIFSRKATLTRTELDASLQVESVEDFSVASKLVDSPFESEALDGFQAAGLSTSAMINLDAQLAQKFSAGSHGLFEKWFLSVWSFAFVLILIVPVLLLKNNTPYIEDTLPNAQISANDTESFQETEHFVDQQEVVSEENDRFVVELEKPVRSNSQGENNLSPTQSPSTVDNRDDLPIRMESRTADLISTREREYNIKKPKAKEIALANYIFIDFRGIRKEKSFKMDPLLSGVQANQSHSGAPKEFETHETRETEVDYHDYLEETAFYMQQNNFKQAHSRFQIILKHFPTDENALFYSAYCLFQLKQFPESLNYLELLKKSAYGNFDEERVWYLFRCYQKLNRNSEATLMAEKIEAQGGFYSPQARDFLKKR